MSEVFKSMPNRTRGIGTHKPKAATQALKNTAEESVSRTVGGRKATDLDRQGYVNMKRRGPNKPGEGLSS